MNREREIYGVANICMREHGEDAVVHVLNECPPSHAGRASSGPSSVATYRLLCRAAAMAALWVAATTVAGWPAM